MSKRALEQRLAAVEGFEDPRAALEQYPTPAALAAHVVHLAALRGDLAGRTVVDLGAGTGMLALGAACRGADRVVGLDVDPAALAVARENETRVAPEAPVSWLVGDADALPLCLSGATVLANPPFGAQDGQAGADRPFLAAAAGVARVSYTVHNAGSEAFVEGFVGERGGRVTDAFAATLALERQFPHHTERRREQAVEVFRVEWA